MKKVDLKKDLKKFYATKSQEFEIVDVPEMQFVMVDGMGTPGTSEVYLAALQALYSVSYALKFMSKIEMERDYVVPPLQGLWWADDLKSYIDDDKEKWRWTMMIMAPNWLNQTHFEAARNKAEAKLGSLPDSVRFEKYHEGLGVQILHIGPYADEAPTIAKLHNEFLPANGLAETGHHHEIYLSDPRRAAPEKLKTILRQPVRRLAS